MPQHSSPAENTAAPRTRTRTDACGREAAADGAAAEVADATTTPPFEAISDSAARTTWRRCSAAAAAQGAVDASRRDARVAQADALRRRLARAAAAASCSRAVAASDVSAAPTDVPLRAASARAFRTASEKHVLDGATEAAGGHVALAQSEILVETIPPRFALVAERHLGLDAQLSAAEEVDLEACLAGFVQRRREAETEEVAAYMTAFLRRTDLDTMSVRSVAVGTGTGGAAGQVALSRRNFLMSNCSRCQATAWTATVRSETFRQKFQHIRPRKRTSR